VYKHIAAFYYQNTTSVGYYRDGKRGKEIDIVVDFPRGKILVERDTKPHESGGILRIYEHKRTGDTFVVLDPKLRLDRLDEVQQQVIALLG